MPRNLSMSELTSRIAEITSGPSDAMVERVVRVLQEHRHSRSRFQVLMATRPVDFRKQADGLAAIVQGAWSRSVLMCRAPICGGAAP